MLRRYAIRQIALLAGGITLAPAAVARALAKGDAILAEVPLTRLELLAEMADTIIPVTDTPGAKAAGVHEYIAVIVEDCFPSQRKADFWRELEQTDAQCLADQGKSFVNCDAAQRQAFFTKLQQAVQDSPNFPQAPAFFTTLKDLCVSGYFTSEIGATQALAYDPIPGGFIADMEIDENTKAWTPMF